MTSAKKSIVRVLGMLQIVIGIGAVPAGFLFIVDPTGASLGFPSEWLATLADTPFKNYLVPGIFLLAVNGIGSLTGAFLTFRRHRRASLAAVGLGAFLMGWIVVQVIALGPPLHWLQILYFVLGAVELLLGWRMNAGWYATRKNSLSPLVWFILGFGIFIFTRMSKLFPTIPVAILIAPIFILRFSRTQPSRRGNLLTLLGFVLSINIGLWGLFDLANGSLSLLFDVARSSLLGVLYALPYMIDRWIYPKFRNSGAAAALIFPTATTAIFFLSSLEGPFDGAVQASKFVYGPVVAQQLLSLLGLWAFIFISSWFASLINYLWENDFEWRRSLGSVITFAALVLTILVFGAIKIASTSPEQNTVKIAAVIVVPEEGDPVSMEQIWADRLVSPFAERIAKIEDLTRIAAANGAKIVSFQEFAMIINEEEEEEVREEYRRIAEQNDVYLSATYAYYAREGKGENKHLLIDNQGAIQLDYTKRYVSGLAELDLGEAGVYRKGPETIQSVATPYGKIAISICRDMEFPAYMRQAGSADVDIMLSPSYEWPKGLVVHSVYMRTIESGFSLVRPTNDGITIAVDFNGHILSQMDSAAAGDGILYADIPTQGINTLYTTVGDTLGWACVLGLGAFLVLSVIRRERRKGVLSRQLVSD